MTTEPSNEQEPKPVPKPGEIIDHGNGSVTIGAPPVRTGSGNPPAEQE